MTSLQNNISEAQEVMPIMAYNPVQTARGSSTLLLKTVCVLQSMTKQIIMRPASVIQPYVMNMRRKGTKLLLQKTYNSVATKAEMPKSHCSFTSWPVVAVVACFAVVVVDFFLPAKTTSKAI